MTKRHCLDLYTGYSVHWCCHPGPATEHLEPLLPADGISGAPSSGDLWRLPEFGVWFSPNAYFGTRDIAELQYLPTVNEALASLPVAHQPMAHACNPKTWYHRLKVSHTQVHS